MENNHDRKICEMVNEYEQQIQKEEPFRQQEAIVKEYLQKLLKEQSVESIGKILDFFCSDEFQQHYKMIGDIPMMFMIFSVYCDEVSNKIGHTVFDISDDYQFLLELYTCMRFLIWDYEFEIGEDSKEELFQRIDQYQISQYFIKKLIDSASFQKKSVFEKLTVEYQRRGKAWV